MHVNYRIARLISGGAVALLIAYICPKASQADVKIETEIRVTGPISALTLGGGAMGRRGQRSSDPASDAQSSSSTDASGGASASPTDSTTEVTTYYKGSLARRETNRGSLVTLYDATADKVTLINSQLKTYCTVSEREAAKLQLDPVSVPGPSASETLAAGMTLDTSVEVDATGLAQTTVGKDTHKFTVYGAVRMVREQQSGGGGGLGRGGGRGRGRGGGGGGYGGGGQGGGAGGGNGGSASGGARIPSTEFDGEYWLADAAILPAAFKSPLLPMLQQTVPDGPILAAVYGKVKHLKMIPLASKVTFAPSSLDPTTRPTVVIETEVKSIQSAPLDDALFTVPEGFQKIDSKAMVRQLRQRTGDVQP